MNLLKGVKYYFSSKMLTMLSSLLLYTMVVNKYGFSNIGVFAKYAAIAAFVELVSDFGYSTLFGINVAKNRNNIKLHSGAFSFSLIQGIFVCGWIFFAAIIFDNSSFIYISILVISGRLIRLTRNYFLNAHEYSKGAGFDLVESLFKQLSLLLCGYFLEFNIYGFILGSALHFAISLVYVFIASRHLFSFKNVGYRHKFFTSEGASFFGTRLLTTALVQIPVVYLPGIIGNTLTGQFVAVKRYGDFLLIPFTIIGNLLKTRVREISNINVLVFALKFGVFFMTVAVVGAGCVDIEVIDTGVLQLSAIVIGAGYFASLFGPSIDYLGGVRKRLVSMLIVLLMQITGVFLGNFMIFYELSLIISLSVIVMLLFENEKNVLGIFLFLIGFNIIVLFWIDNGFSKFALSGFCLFWLLKNIRKEFSLMKKLFIEYPK